MSFDINKPWLSLDTWQKEYIEEKGNCHICCGRQSGKSAAMSIKIAEFALKEKTAGDYLVIALTENQAYALFFKTLMYLQAKYPKYIAMGKDKPTKHIITLKNGMRINCYAAGEHGLGLRHFTLKKLFMDECAPMNREIIIAVSPMLSVTNGTIDMASTPMGKQGFFYDYTKRDDFRKFHISAEDCPRHTKEFLENEKKSMTKLEYAKEYLALFLDEFRRVFSEDWVKDICTIKRPNDINLNNRMYMGVDIARMGKDESVFAIIEKVSNEDFRQVQNIITKKTFTTDTERKIIELAMIYPFKIESIGLDAGAGTLGVSVLDHLLNTNIKNKIVAINNRERVLDRDGNAKKKILKEDLYNNLVAMGERKEIKLLDDNEIKLSLASVLWELNIEKGKESKLLIYGDYTHCAEAIIRAAYLGYKDKHLNIWCA